MHKFHRVEFKHPALREAFEKIAESQNWVCVYKGESSDHNVLYFCPKLRVLAWATAWANLPYPMVTTGGWTDAEVITISMNDAVELLMAPPPVPPRPTITVGTNEIRFDADGGLYNKETGCISWVNLNLLYGSYQTWMSEQKTKHVFVYDSPHEEIMRVILKTAFAAGWKRYNENTDDYTDVKHGRWIMNTQKKLIGTISLSDKDVESSGYVWLSSTEAALELLNKAPPTTWKGQIGANKTPVEFYQTGQVKIGCLTIQPGTVEEIYKKACVERDKHNKQI